MNVKGHPSEIRLYIFKKLVISLVDHFDQRLLNSTKCKILFCGCGKYQLESWLLSHYKASFDMKRTDSPSPTVHSTGFFVCLFLVLLWISLIIDSVMGWDSLSRKKESGKSFFILRLGAMFTHVMRCDAINFAPHKENRADLLLIAGCLSRALCHRSWCDIVTAAPYVPYLCWGKKNDKKSPYVLSDRNSRSI